MTSTWRATRPAFAGLVALGCLAAGACSTTDGQEAVPGKGPYAAEFTEAMDVAKSDFVRQVLSDGQIEAAEYDEARQGMLGCLKDAGIEAKYIDDQSTAAVGGGLTILSGELTDQQRTAERTCDDQWMGPIDSLYASTRTNPQNQDMNKLIAACLVREGLAPDGFTAEDYVEWYDSNVVKGEISESDPGGMVSIQPDDLPPPQPLPGSGVTLDDPRVMTCRLDPLGKVTKADG